MAIRKKLASWKQRDGKTVEIADMTDTHLANALRMIGRTWGTSKYLGSVTKNSHFKSLSAEAKKRNFVITLLDKPKLIHGKKEYIDIFIPPPRSKIMANFFPTDIDSRPQE